MKKNQFNTNSYMESDSVDILKLFKIVWSGRKLIAKITLISFIIGFVVAVSSPIIYEAQTTFVPQTSDQNSSATNKGLGSLASLAGINLNAEAASSLDNYISPLLYSKIIDSEEFCISLLEEKIFLSDETELSIKDYLNRKKSNFNLFMYIRKYTIDLLIGNEKRKNIDRKFYNDYNFISDENFGLINNFKLKFSVEANKKEGYIKVKATDQDPFVSAQLVKIITKNLQSRIISLRTNKIKEQLEYSKTQYENKKSEFYILQNNLANFKDSNKNISTAKFLAQQQRLESEYQLQNSILTNLASEYNNNKIKLNKNTPIFSVLDEVSVPNNKSKPDRFMIISSFVFIGFLISIIYIFSFESIKNMINQLRIEK